jgi:hypothetical protein
MAEENRNSANKTLTVAELRHHRPTSLSMPQFASPSRRRAITLPRVESFAAPVKCPDAHTNCSTEIYADARL